MTLCTSDQVLGAIPARTNETYRYRKTATAASPLVAVSASWEGTWEIGHMPRFSAAPKTWPRSKNWVLGNRSIGRGYQRACRSWSMRKRITATPLPLRELAERGYVFIAQHGAGGDYDAGRLVSDGRTFREVDAMVHE